MTGARLCLALRLRKLLERSFLKDLSRTFVVGVLEDHGDKIRGHR